MATGTIQNNYRGYTVKTVWTSTPDVANNQSTITAVHTLICGSGYSLKKTSALLTCTFCGVVKTTSTSINTSGGTTISLGTTTHTVVHNSDGSKSGTITTKFDMAATISGVYVSNITATGDVTLDTIARASTFTIADSSINLGEALSVSISRASTSFTHTVKYICGSQTVSHTGVTTSDSYTTPLSWSSQVPNGTLLSGTVIVETYLSGSLIGSKSATFKAYVPSSVVPTISSLGLTGASLLDGTYVKGRSKVTATINGEAGVYGSTISSRSIIGGGYSSTADSFQTGFLNTVGTNTFTAKVTDSRGRTATKTASIVVYDYALPVLTATAQRVNDSGSYDLNGTRIKVTASMAFSSVNSKNSKTLLRFRYKTSTGSWSSYTTITGTHYFTASVDYHYTVSIEYADEISGTLTKQIDVSSSISSIDVKAGGDGIAFGGSATKSNTAEFFYDVEVKGSRVVDRSNFFVIDEFAQVTATGEVSYTGLSVTIPANSFYVITGRAMYNSSMAKNVRLSKSASSYLNEAISQTADTTYGNYGFLDVTTSGHTGSEITFYLWANYAGTTKVNSVYIRGFYIKF